jgi:hypothetical protein
MFFSFGKLGPITTVYSDSRVGVSWLWPTARHLPLAAFAGIAIERAGGGDAALGCCMEPTVHRLDFLQGKIARTLAEQHSVLIIHTVSPFQSRHYRWPARHWNEPVGRVQG